MAGTSDTHSQSHGISVNPPAYQPDLSVALSDRPRRNSSSSTNGRSSGSNSVDESDKIEKSEIFEQSEKSDSPDVLKPGVLVFVEAVIRDNNSDFLSANIFADLQRKEIYSYNQYTTDKCVCSRIELHVACITAEAGYREVLNQLLDGIERTEPKYIAVKNWKPTKAGVRSITVIWDGVESTYSNEQCKTKITLKTDKQIKLVLGKMRERGWKDRFEVEFALEM
ncbi:hypothetical protein BKA64DRAFT_648996 [Cadophora sp. MPI-SDFR-AT-0126]|nr:hypothetical protein BKA64DRAFT_648996 [Leotiomycetes sp. MPI-SDFR-AT-0126]